MMENIREYLKNPYKFFIPLASRGMFDSMPDEMYLKLMFHARMGKKLNLKDPKTFNEKLQWLKLYNRKPEYTKMVDKYEAKKYIAEKIGEEYIIPTIGVWNSFDEIDFAKLPNQFVLKCTHDSGGLVICKDKQKLDIEAAREKIEKSLKNNYYLWGREWPYKNVKPRIIAEQFMVDSKTEELRDFKFFCFGGQAKCFKVDFDRFIEHHANYYDVEGKALNFGEVKYSPNYDKVIKLPGNIGKMEELAQKLSYGEPFLRADFYDVDGKIYFGEMTFYPASGFGKFTDDKWDELLGKWITIGGAAAYNPKNRGCIKRKKVAVTEVEQDCLTDYKFFCFNGVPKIVYISKDKADNPTTDFFDMDFNHLPIRMRDPNSKQLPLRPAQFEEMKKIAAILSSGFPHLRVDFYFVNNKLYVGELTFYHCSGFAQIYPESWEVKMGEWIQLPSK